jgi:photosystem II PsbY protein
VAVSTAVSTFLLAGNAQAAQEIAAIAGDNRFGTISLLFVPVLGWVGFNILGPVLKQLENMSGEPAAPKKGTKRAAKRASLAAAVVGVSVLATMLTASNAEAATEVAQLAGSDGRVGAILTLFVPAVGWVAFNIFGPAMRQLDTMSEVDAPKATKKLRRKAGVAAAVGLSAVAGSALLAESASAATEIAQLAGSDGRVAAIATLFVPALAWVAFNIFGPALRQLDNMSGEDAAPKKTKKVTKKKSVGAAIGLTAAASMLAVESANAATEFAQVAATDSRVGVILTLFVPAVAWVGFNIFGPALRQLDNMSADTAVVAKKTTRIAKKK